VGIGQYKQARRLPLLDKPDSGPRSKSAILAILATG
jgi:hypothetical protein